MSLLFSPQFSWSFDPVDLTRLELYARSGFEAAWATTKDFSDDWLALPSRSEFSHRSVQVRRLPLSTLPERHFLSFKNHPPEAFTFAIRFSISREEAEKPGSLGLLIGSIGVNWEIFLNGKSLRKEIYLTGAGDIRLSRCLNNVVVELDKQFINTGDNTLVFKVIGDPTDPETGFYTGHPFFIDRFEAALEKSRFSFTRVLISLYLFIGLFFIYMFFKNKRQPSYLTFGLFCVDYFIYKISMDDQFIAHIVNTNITVRIEFISLFLLIPLILAFLDHFISKGTSLFVRGYAVFASILIGFCFFAPLAFLHDLLRVFQLAIPMGYGYILYLFYTKWYQTKRRREHQNKPIFLGTLEGRLLLGISICFVIGMVDVFRSLFYLTTYQISQYAFFLISFPMGLALGQQFTQAQKELIRSQQLIAQGRQEAIDNLKRADRLKDEFLATTSHELRTPLHGIIGLTQSSLDAMPSPHHPPLVRNLKNVLSCARRLAMQLDDILDYSRLKNQDLKLKPVPLDLHSIADVVIALFSHLAKKKSIELCNAVPADTAFVMADENRVYQIFQNLVANAVKFTTHGKVKIFIRSSEDCFAKTFTDSDSSSPMTHDDNETLFTDNASMDMILIGVKDSGIGIAPEQLDTVFLSFTQLESPETRGYEGMGLGLSITKQLVEQHGGRIRVESQPGVGSTFYFTLPATQQAPNVDTEKDLVSTLVGDGEYGDCHGSTSAETNFEENAEGTTEAAKKEEKGKETVESSAKPVTDKPAIWVVDDDPINLQIVEEYLGRNYSVRSFSDGKDVLVAMETARLPNLILLDIMMPGISGLAVCRKIRADHGSEKLPILFLSAKNQVSDLTQGFDLGANDYLSKPFSKHELLTRVGFHIDFNVQVETAGKRLEALKTFCSDLKNFKGKTELAVAIHTLLSDQIASDGSVLLWDQTIFRCIPEPFDASFLLKADIPYNKVDDTPKLCSIPSPNSPDYGRLMVLKMTYLDEFSFLLYRNAQKGTFSRADHEFAVTALREAAFVKDNIRNFIQDEAVLKKYLDLQSRIDEIFFIQADRQFCKILFEDQRDFTTFDWSLGDIETYFDESKLFRVHRSFMVNPQKSIRAVKEKGSRDFRLQFPLPEMADVMKGLELSNGIRVSRTKEKICKSKFPHWFQ